MLIHRLVEPKVIYVHGDLLDLLLIALAVLAGFGGYRRGLICSITSFVGFVAGALIGVQIAPALARGILRAPSNAIAADQAVGQRIVSLAVVLVLAAIGNFAGQLAGQRLKALVERTPFGQVDGIGGAVVSVVSLFAVAWLFALALAYVPAPTIARQIHRSLVLQTIDRVIPNQGQQVVSALLREVQQHDLPAVSGPFATLLAPSVAAPDPAVVPGPPARPRPRSSRSPATPRPAVVPSRAAGSSTAPTGSSPTPTWWPACATRG